MANEQTVGQALRELANLNPDTLTELAESISQTELDYLDGVTAGTQAAGKAVVADSNVNTGVSKVTELHIGTSGSETQVTATGTELNLTDNMPADITFAAAAGAANICEVTITVKDAAAATIASVFNLDIWLSDAATGAGLTGTSASGTVQAKAASGADIGTYTAKKALRVQTLATGIYILEITDTAKTGFYPCAALPSTGETIVGTQLVTGDYG